MSCSKFYVVYMHALTLDIWHTHTKKKNRNIGRWNNIESPDINPCTYGYLIFDKGDKNIQWGKGKTSSISGARKTGELHIKKMKLEHFLMPYTKIKWIKDLNLRPEL